MKNKGKSGKLDKNGIISHIDDSEDVTFEDVEDSDTQANKVKKLQKKLKECNVLKQEYLNGWQRTKADAVNLRKSEEEKRKRTAKFAEENLLVDLLPALDSFDMAFANKEAWEKVDKNWRIGVEHILTQLLTILKQYNLEPFDPEGDQFDPARHNSIEAIITQKKSDDGKIVEVLQKGYLLNNKIIRPAKVKIAEYKK